MAGKRNIQVTKGDDYSHVITITNSAGVIDITGRTYSAQVRRVPSQTTADLTFTVVVTNAMGGEITLYLTDTQTNSLDPGDYRWDFQENASGITTTVLSGKFTVVGDVTRPS